MVKRIVFLPLVARRAHLLKQTTVLEARRVAVETCLCSRGPGTGAQPVLSSVSTGPGRQRALAGVSASHEHLPGLHGSALPSNCRGVWVCVCTRTWARERDGYGYTMESPLNLESANQNVRPRAVMDELRDLEQVT